MRNPRAFLARQCTGSLEFVPSQRLANFLETLQVRVPVANGLRQGVHEYGRPRRRPVQHDVVVGPQDEFQVVEAGGVVVSDTAQSGRGNGRRRSVQVGVGPFHDGHVRRAFDGVDEALPRDGGVGRFGQVRPGWTVPAGIPDRRRADSVLRGGDAAQPVVFGW